MRITTKFLSNRLKTDLPYLKIFLDDMMGILDMGRYVKK